MALIKCGKCGSELDTIPAECPRCGAPVPRDEPGPAPSVRNRSPRTLVVLIACILGIALLAFWTINSGVIKSGTTTPPPVKVNLEELKARAERGEPEAQTMLGRLSAKGHEVPQSYQQAALWYRKAADQNYAPAQVALGELHEAGQGVPLDEAAAAEWYRKAADQGYAPGQYNLGMLYALGKGVTLNDAEAIALYQKAAAQGDALSQYNLGIRFLRGKGVSADPIEAYKWLSLAGTHGVDDALTARADLKTRMTRDQLKEAQRRADTFVQSITPAR